MSTVVDDETSSFAHTGLYQEDLIVLRPMLSNDPPAPDYSLSDSGFFSYVWGTVPAFMLPPADTVVDPFEQIYALDHRPPLRTVSGPYGYHRYGNIPLFDNLAELSDAELAAYIQGGMESKVARPELTGRHLQALAYFIRVFSIQGKLETIDPNAIAANLEAAGHYGPNSRNDLRIPEIRNVEAKVTGPGTVRVSWQTDEPTIGLAQFGPTDYYGLASAIEPAYAKDHAVTVEDLKQDTRCFYQILSKDQAGNLTYSQGSFDVGIPPPILCGDVNKNGTVAIADAVLLAQIIAGSKPPPQPPCIADLNSDDRTNVVDLVLLIEFILGQVASISCCGG